MAIITCEKLSLGYEGKVIVKDLDFSVDQGDYLVILGENGSGKSTLMNTLLGLKKPISGKIGFGDGLIQNQIGYLPQQTEVQKDFPATAWEIVLSGHEGKCGFRAFYSKEEKLIAEQNMERLGISELKNRCFRELSGGQKQRVLLARALCATEKLILLDEPCAGLDPKVTLEMYEIISSLNKEGIAVIMISHDLENSLKYATHILHIGHKLFFGTKEEYIESDLYSALSKGREE